jgi:NAD(P)-dependent dehydrogenase (short-subunit alcohol dehydrogenase family)
MSTSPTTTDSQTTPRGRLEGKVALVVGGGWSGPEDGALSVGCAISQHFVREGARVAVMDIDESNADRTIKRIRSEGGDALKVVADTADKDDCRRAVDETVGHFGQLDCVVNNVGLGLLPAEVDPTSDAAFERVLAVNFTGLILMVREAARHLPRGGAIVNVGSVFGAIDPIPGAYGISKRAESLVLTPTFAAEYAPRGIRVNCVSIGYIWNAVTQATKAVQGRADETLEEFRRGRPANLTALNIEGDGWDVAKAVEFLASDDARFITGQDLMVEGGYSLLNVWDHTPYGRRRNTLADEGVFTTLEEAR